MEVGLQFALFSSYAGYLHCKREPLLFSDLLVLQ
jgi:hypothetical protein